MKILDSRAGYNLYAPDYRKAHAHLDSFDWSELQPLLTGLITSQIAAANRQKVSLLDLGCGDGRILKRLVRLRENRGWGEQLQLEGWDISSGMLGQARKVLPPNVQLVCQDLRETPINSPLFSVVCSFFVLVHIDDPTEFLQITSRLLEPGGVFVFNNIPQREALVLENHGHKFQIDYTHHEPQTIRDCIDSSDLELIDQRATAWSELFVTRKKTAP